MSIEEILSEAKRLRSNGPQCEDAGDEARSLAQSTLDLVISLCEVLKRDPSK